MIVIWIEDNNMEFLKLRKWWRMKRKMEGRKENNGMKKLDFENTIK